MLQTLSHLYLILRLIYKFWKTNFSFGSPFGTEGMLNDVWDSAICQATTGNLLLLTLDFQNWSELEN